MRIINTASPPNDPRGRLALYSGMDVLSLFEINESLDRLLTPESKAIYDFELQLQSPLLEMSFTGLLVDQHERDRLTREHEAELKKVESTLHQLCEAVGYYDFYLDLAIARFSTLSAFNPSVLPRSWDAWVSLPLKLRRQIKDRNPEECLIFQKAIREFSAPINGGSPDQKLRLFYDFFGHEGNSVASSPSHLFNKSHGISEIKSRNTKGDFVPSADRAAMEKIIERGDEGTPRDAAYWARPFALCCLEISDYKKVLGFLKCKLENGYFRYSYGTTTETGRLASRENAQGFGSNSQNISPRLRTILCAEPGYKIAALDFEQIESRIVGAICYRLFGAVNYLNATECGDLHTLCCSLVWPDLPWPTEFTIDYINKYGPFPKDLIKASKQLANAPLYRDFTKRDLVKRLGHGSNYLGKASHMAKLTHIDLDLVEHFQQTYFSAFPEIKRWQRWVAEQIQTTGEITTFLGRPRKFFSRPNDDATIREAVAYEPQSIAADYTNQALLKLYQAQVAGLPIKIHTQKHDELSFRYLEKDEELVVSEAKKIMQQTITIYSPDRKPRNWMVPADVLTGWNLGFASPTNPDGLAKYPDTRSRQQANPNSLLKRRFG
jgi:DNA polymerase family A